MAKHLTEGAQTLRSHDLHRCTRCGLPWSPRGGGYQGRARWLDCPGCRARREGTSRARLGSR